MIKRGNERVGKGPLGINFGCIIKKHLVAFKRINDKAFIGVGQVSGVGVAVLHI